MSRPLPATLLALLLAACTTPPGPPAGAAPDALAQVGRWTLQGASDASGAPMTVLAPRGTRVHAVTFDGARIAILGGCNHIGAAYRYDAGGMLVVGPMQSTLMACADPARMEADAALAALLEGTAGWRIAESWPEQLLLDHDDGSRSHWVAARAD